MGLLNINNEYIKLSILNENRICCKFYTSEDQRVIEKNSSDPNAILLKYQELIKKSRNDTYKKLQKHNLQNIWIKGADPIDPSLLPEATNIIKKFYQLCDEYQQYMYNLQNPEAAEYEYKIMSTYFPDIKESIPKVKASISFNLDIAENDNLELVYNKVKELKIFGKTTDC